MEIQGKTALVTGAARRVGREIALTLARKGAHLILHYGHSRKEAEDLARTIQALGVRATIMQADLANSHQCYDLVRTILKQGTIDIVINNASIFHKTPFEKVTMEDWDQNVAVNLRAPFILGSQLGYEMKKKGSGKIINIIDWAAMRPYKDYLPYCVSKGGLLTLTQTLALELAPHVQVNGIAPGPVLPPESFTEENKKRLKLITPLQRLGSPDDIAKTVSFLLEGTDFITGAIIPVDGGRHIAPSGKE